MSYEPKKIALDQVAESIANVAREELGFAEETKSAVLERLQEIAKDLGYSDDSVTVGEAREIQSQYIAERDDV